MLRRVLPGVLLVLLAMAPGCGGEKETPSLVQKDPEAVRTLLRRGPKGMQQLEEKARQEQQGTGASARTQ